MKNTQRNSLLYGFYGVVIGGLVVWLITTSVVNNNATGMMQMMGIRANNITSGMVDNIDRHFIEQMIPHHEGAIDMSKLAQDRSTHTEIKTLASNIIQSQSEEINLMKKWYTNWYGTEVPEDSEIGMGMGRGMMRGGMMGDKFDIELLSNSPDFDKTFLEEMLPHHQMAIMMANMLLQGTNRTEMRQLAQNIIDAQTKEIIQMQSWYKSWYN